MGLLENIAYNTGTSLTYIILFVLVAVCTVVAVIEIVKYYGQRKGEGNLAAIIRNTWKNMGTGGRICVYIILGGAVLAIAIKILLMLYLGW